MIIEQAINRAIANNLRAKAELEKSLHKSSGALSASRLFWPLQSQILYSLGVPTSEFDDYTLGKFARGNHVEEFVVSNIPGVVDTQVSVEYRGVVGYVDAVVNSDEHDFKEGIMPHEVKSVANAKFKWISKRMTPDVSHALQATLYGLALKRRYAVIDYVAADDYRVLSFVIPVQDYQEQVDQIISEYENAMQNWKENGVLPELVAREDWQLRPEWSSYPQCLGKTAQEVKEMFGLIIEKSIDK